MDWFDMRLSESTAPGLADGTATRDSLRERDDAPAFAGELR